MCKLLHEHKMPKAEPRACSVQAQICLSRLSLLVSGHQGSDIFAAVDQLASLTPSYFSTLVERPIIHKPNRIYCSCANRPYMVPEAKHISMNAAGAEDEAIQGLTTVTKRSRSHSHCANRSYMVPEAQHNHACCMRQGRSDPRAHLCY
jgi:hypothetical protein